MASTATRSPPTSRASEARSSVVVTTLRGAAADRLNDAAATAPKSPKVLSSCLLRIFNAFLYLLEHQSTRAPEHTLEDMCPMCPNPEIQLNEEFVRPAPFAVARVAILSPNLAELTRPERQEHRAAGVPKRRVQGLLRPIQPRADIPPPGELVFGQAVHPERSYRRL